MNDAERVEQPSFRFKWLILIAFLILSAGVLAGDARRGIPDREPQPPAATAIRFDPLPIGRWSAPREWKILGAWTLEADDPRFAGLSALVTGGPGKLLGLTDSGVLVTMPKPGSGGMAHLADLAAGPGYPTYKKYRDSEALVRRGGELIVAFENRHSLWRFGRTPPRGQPLPSRTWGVNAGVEAMVPLPQGLLLLAEESDEALLQAPDGAFHPVPLMGRQGGLADAAILPDGRVLVAERGIGLLGIRNRLAWLERWGEGYRLRPAARLPLGPFDNVEGLAAEPMPGGFTRLWAVTDNDGWRRTLLVKMQIPPARPARTGKAGG